MANCMQNLTGNLYNSHGRFLRKLNCSIFHNKHLFANNPGHCASLQPMECVRELPINLAMCKQVWARAQSKRLVFNRKIAIISGSWSRIFHRPVYLHIAGAIIREHIDTALTRCLVKMSNAIISCALVIRRALSV